LNTKDLEIRARFIEALLFLENRPVNIKHIAKVAKCSREAVQDSILKLKNMLKESGSSLIIEENDRGDFHLTISPDLYSQLAEYYNVQKRVRLSSQALETLAIVAYKQPITRSEIERIRGVQVGYILKVLLEQRIIKIIGKKNAPGRPLLYGTTDEFLKYFGLLSIKDLPPISEFERL
jgi:segregation and condensation protein B